jgi:hypothetical protein
MPSRQLLLIAFTKIVNILKATIKIIFIQHSIFNGLIIFNDLLSREHDG